MQYWKLIVLLQVFHSLVHHDKGSNLVISQEILYNCLFVQFLRFWIVNLTVEIKLKEPMQVLNKKKKSFMCDVSERQLKRSSSILTLLFPFLPPNFFLIWVSIFDVFSNVVLLKKVVEVVIVVQKSPTTYCTTCKIFLQCP